MKTALIAGVSGQDGAYLTRLLLEKGYKVYGAYRRTSSVNFWRVQELSVGVHPNLELMEYDLTDPGCSLRLIAKTKHDEVYNLAAQSFVAVSFDQPITTAKITGLGALHLLDTIRTVKPDARFYQASTSEMFGKVQSVPENEETRFWPRSPYRVAKLFAHWITVNYRESYGIFGASGILFNHESPLRGQEFVTRKITHAVASIKLGKQACVEPGNLDAKRDWGCAGDYVEGMWRMLQADRPDMFVLATGRTESVRDSTTLAFKALGIRIAWQGAEQTETGIRTDTGDVVVRVNPKFYRPAEVATLTGDAGKAHAQLGWQARTMLEELCKMMVEADLARVQRGISF